MIDIEYLGQIIPGPAAAGVACLDSNNNLDICVFEQRLYIAWRTAPTHFASASARIEISSMPFTNGMTDVSGPWRHETTVIVGADVREPRWVIDGQRLQLFFMELGTDPKRFQPRRTHRLSLDDGVWTSSELEIETGFVPWRIRHLHGRWAMLGYRGGESMYGPRPANPAVQVRWSDDLISWEPAVDVHQGGIECELVELADGRLAGVTRNEGPVRFGSDVVVGPDLGHLDIAPIRRKLDSPNLFTWNGQPWLFARRSVSFGGNYDLAPAWLPGGIGIRVNQAVWSTTRKRSALYRLDVERREVIWEADLPSRGDTSFAGVIIEASTEDRADTGPNADGDSLLVADYTSPERGGDVSWIRGQLRPTIIQMARIRTV